MADEIPMKKAASPMPSTSRAATTMATEVAGTSSSNEVETPTEPNSRRNRRPRRSPSGPMRGRSNAAEKPNAPTDRPMATPPPPSSCSTKAGTTGHVLPSAVK